MIFIKNAKVFTMEGETFDKGDVIVKDGKIQEVGENLTAPEGATVIDGEGKILMPGMIDAHTHLGLFEDAIGFEGNDVNEMTDPSTPHLRAIDGVNPMDKTFKDAVMGGITSTATGPGSANVIGGQFAIIKTHGDFIDDMIVEEYNAMKVAFGENPKRVYAEKKTSPMTRMATAAVLRENLLKAKAYKEKKEEAGIDKSKMPAYDMKMEALQPVLERKVPLKAHAHRADDILTAIRIAKEFNTKITLEHCTEGHLIADIIKRENLSAVVGPSFGHNTKFELKNKTFETPGVLNRAGVKVAIMTDHPVIPIESLPMAAALAVKSGMDPLEALKAITIYPAEILGMESRLGSIKAGKDGDLVLWDKNPLDIQAKVAVTIINGEVVYEA